MWFAFQWYLTKTETISESFDYLFVLTVIGNKNIHIRCLQLILGYGLCYIPNVVHKEYSFRAFIANTILNDGIKETIIPVTAYNLAYLVNS